jgi:hypothetical protein
MENYFVLDQDELASGGTAFQSHLHSLQYLIVELLIKNQQLRDRLRNEGEASETPMLE